MSEGSGLPTSEGSGRPTSEGSGRPKSEGSGRPTSEGSGRPMSEGSGRPTSEGLGRPKSERSGRPTSEGSGRPTSEGSGRPIRYLLELQRLIRIKLITFPVFASLSRMWMFTKMKLGRDPPPEFKVYKIQFQMAPKSLEAYQHAVDHYTSILLVR